MKLGWQIKTIMLTKKRLFEVGRPVLDNLLDTLHRAENEDALPAAVINPPTRDARLKVQRHKSKNEIAKEHAAKKKKASGEKAVQQQAERDARAARTRVRSPSAPAAKRARTSSGTTGAKAGVKAGTKAGAKPATKK